MVFHESLYLCAPFIKSINYAEDEDPFQRQEAIQGDWFRQNQARKCHHAPHDAQKNHKAEAPFARRRYCECSGSRAHRAFAVHLIVCLVNHSATNDHYFFLF